MSHRVQSPWVRNRVTPGVLRWAGVKNEAQPVITFPILRQRNQPVTFAAVVRLVISLNSSSSNGRLLSPEPVVVEVSPDPSASTMTGGAESSNLSGTLDCRRTTDTPGCFCWYTGRGRGPCTRCVVRPYVRITILGYVVVKCG
jgi:hypothetical protein